MTDVQIFQLFGITYLAIGIGAVTARQFYKNMITGFMESPPLIYLGGLAALVVGFLLVTFHNIWVKDWPVIITIIGWAALIKGICLVTMPKLSMKSAGFFTKIMAGWSIFVILFGILCCWLGFFAI